MEGLCVVTVVNGKKRNNWLVNLLIVKMSSCSERQCLPKLISHVDHPCFVFYLTLMKAFPYCRNSSVVNK